MKILGIASGNDGTDNQIRGVILEGAKGTGHTPITREDVLKGIDGKAINPKNYASPQEFQIAVDAAINKYMKDSSVPEFVVLPYDHASKDWEISDLLSKAVKNSYAKLGHEVKTMVMASGLHDYRSIDLIHVGKHLLSKEDEQKIASNPKLKAKIVETLGVPSNISRESINNAANQPKVKPIIDKYKKFKEEGKKVALFSLGGKTENGFIKFTIDDAQKLLTSAKLMTMYGYKVVFTNSPRTPNDVTDFLHENCPKYGIEFYNSKKVATTEEEKNNFRNYDGKYNAEFAEKNAIVGNIYPAILCVCDFVVNTHDSFSYTSDAAAIGIPSVVYSGNEIDRTKRPDCYKLYEECKKKGHIIDLNEAMDQITKREKIQTKPMSNVSNQLTTAMDMTLSHSRCRSSNTQAL